MMKSKLVFIASLMLFLGMLSIHASVVLSSDGNGAAYNVTIVTDNAPDMTDLEHYLWSITSQFDKPQDKAINIWRWSQRLRKQTSNPVEDGALVIDPMLLFNSYGHCNCGIVSGLNNTFWLNMGWKAHYVQLGDHTVCETSWDGGNNWHMFDASMSIYVFNEKGEVASTREIEQNPNLYLKNFAPECGTNPVNDVNDHQGWRCAADRPVLYKRSLANGVDSFLPPNDIQEFNLLTRWGQPYVLNLRPCENYTRYFKRLDEPQPDAHFYRPLPNGTDAEKEHGHGNFRANGVWEFAPDLKDSTVKDLVYSESGLSWEQHADLPAIHPKQGDAPGVVIFKINAANVVTSARIRINGTRSKKSDAMTLSVSRDGGINWIQTWTAAKTGKIDLEEITLSDAVAGVTQYLVKIKMKSDDPTGIGLDALVIKTITQLNRPALPKLTRGVNRVQAKIGRPVETLFLRPALQDGRYKKTIFAEDNIEVEPKPGFYKATLRPKEKGRPAYVTWKVETPKPINDFSYGGNVTVYNGGQRVALLHSWDGETFTKDFEQTDDSMPRDHMVWLDVKSSNIPTGATTIFLRYEFDGAIGYGAPGIQSAAFCVRREPRQTAFAPLEVTYCWTEHRKTGDVTRTHTELVTSLKHEYCINVGGYRDPTMQWVRLNLQGYGLDRPIRYGYNDGEDVGSKDEPAWERYQWGTNLALHKPYHLDGSQSKRNPDSDHDLTDGIVAPPDDYVSEKYMPTNVMFDKDVSPVVTLDLEEPQTVSAMRVYAGQPEVKPIEGYRFAYPDRIDVEISTDGRSWIQAGYAEHDQVFNPPADFVPWEHDDDPQFASLPAGGRLHYGYRVIFDKPLKARYIRVTCACRPEWGVLLSEVQVFDQVTVDSNFPPLVVLPNIQTEE